MAFCRWAWQHEPFALIDGESHSRALPRQQSGCPVECAASRQAEAGIAVQRTTTASISNALFLLQFIVSKSQVSTVSIRCRAFCGSDLDHTRGVPKSKPTDLKIPKPPTERECIAQFYEAKAQDYRTRQPFSLQPDEAQLEDKHHNPLSYTSPFPIHTVDADFTDPYAKRGRYGHR